MHTINYRRLELTSGCRILDLGCGEGRHSIGIPGADADTTIVGVDLSFKDLKSAKAKLPLHNDFCRQAGLPEAQAPSWLQADATCLPFADGSFDRVICSEVLEHIEPYRQVLAEIGRVLKPGGKLAVSVPRQWPERLCWSFSDEYSREPGGHIRIFNARHLRRDIEAIGARFRHQHGAHALHSPYWWLKCLLWQHPEHPLLTQYHKFLVWDLTRSPWVTRSLEKLLNPFMGKSVVLYFDRL